MMSFHLPHLALVGVAGLVLAMAGPAQAQTAKPAAPVRTSGNAPAAQPAPAKPVGAEPGATTATWGDWLMRCQRIGEGDKAIRACVVAQTIQVADRPAPLAQIALGRVPGDAGLHLTAALPVNLSFPASVQVTPAGTGAPTITLEVRRCVPAACFAETRLSDEQIKALGAGEAQGRLSFRSATGQTVAVPISPRGLLQAIAALDKEK